MMFQNSKNISFLIYEFNLGWDSDFTLHYDVISPLYFNVAPTSDTDFKPTLDCKAHKFGIITVN